MEENEMMNEDQPLQVIINGIPALDYGKRQSAIKPDPVVVNESGVWVHSSIEPLQDSEGWEYDLIQYDRRDYERMQLQNPGGTDPMQANLNAFTQGQIDALGGVPNE